jgi:Acyl-CoA thioester hydrolase/BAAT N-terminal region
MWASWALFRADHTGLVDMRSQVPEDGTYRTLDAMGLFWSMYPTTDR